MTAIAAETYEYEVPPQAYARPIPVPDGTGHVWMVAAAFGISQGLAERMVENPQGSPVGLDHENLLSVSPVVCYKCEQPLSAEIVKAPCSVLTLNLHGPNCACPK